MELAEQKKEQQNSNASSNSEKTETQGASSGEKTSSLRPVLIGSAAGIGIGLLASPTAAKKVAGKVSESEFVRTSTRELRRTAQEMVTEQAVFLMKQGAMNSFYKYQEKLGAGNAGASDSTDDRKQQMQRLQDDQYKELKEENENLNDKLEHIEDKLDRLMEKLESS